MSRIISKVPYFISFCLFLTPAVTVRADPPVDLKTRNSVSAGTPMNGRLQYGEVLPKKGAGYVLTPEARRRRARFGVPELVALIKEVAFKVYRKFEDSTLGVADLSVRRGGLIDHHGSHQNGRDVDLLFYLSSSAGHPVTNLGFVPIDKNGFSTDPPMEYRFDPARNWALVEALIRSRQANVQWIFVADHIKDLIIGYTEANGVSPLLIRKAKQMLRQPGNKAHSDHFHVRIYCPEDDKPTCEDVGPRWAWIK